MSTTISPMNLSVRGQILAGGNDTSEIFEVIKNLWDPETNPDGFVSLGVAENDMMHTELVAYIEKVFRLPHKYLTYLDGGAGSKRLQKAVARFLTRRLNPIKPVETEHVVVTNGTSTCLESISYILADPGDGFLLGQPYYRSFLPDMEMRPGSQIVKVSFGDADPMGMDCVPHYERAIRDAQAKNQRIGGLVLCHPHNPLGRCYAPEVIIALMKLCQQHRIHLISDEIYAFSIWENKEDTSPPPIPFTSALAIDTTDVIDAHLVHVVWGMSKDFGANGLRIGCVISQANRDLLASFGTLSLYGYPSNVADYITSAILEDDQFTDAYIAKNAELLSSRYSTAVRYLKEHDIPYAPGANAAFFICADIGTAYRRRRPGLDPSVDITKLVKEKLTDKRIFLVDSNAIGSEKPGWFRIVFSQTEEYLLEGLKRMVAVVEDVNDNGQVVRNGNHVALPERPRLEDRSEGPPETVLPPV